MISGGSERRFATRVAAVVMVAGTAFMFVLLILAMTFNVMETPWHMWLVCGYLAGVTTALVMIVGLGPPRR